MTQYMQEAGAMKQADDMIAPILRGMAENYALGNLWDHLDAEACQRGAAEITRLRAALAAALPPAAVQAWIPVTERLPDEEVPVMVFTPAMDGDEERIDFDFRYEGGWHNHNDCYDHFMAVGGSNAVPGEVCTGPDSEAPYTHWMPIPASPLAANEGTLTAGKQGGQP